MTEMTTETAARERGGCRYSVTFSREGVVLRRDEGVVLFDEPEDLQRFLAARYAMFFIEEMAFNGTYWLFGNAAGDHITVDLEDIQDDEWEAVMATGTVTAIGPICTVCGLPAEGGARSCACTCPRCGVPTFDDVTIADHGMCRECLARHQWGEDA